MKRIIVYFAMPLFLLTACHNKELDQLKQENDQLKKNLEQRDQDISNFMQIFNDIEENLAQIRIREQLITKQSGSLETGINKVDAVKNDLKAIDELMQQNRQNIKSLSEKLKASRLENKEFQRLVANLQKTITEKDMEIVGLVKELEDLHYEVQDLYSSVSKLETENVEKEQVIDNQDKELNTVYYLIGNEKDFKEKEIITKTGGFAGIGRVEKLNQDLNENLFTKIDLREKTTFAIDAKKAILLTTHPSDSYLIRKNDEKRYFSFEITKPEAFWKSSRYLVLMLD